MNGVVLTFWYGEQHISLKIGKPIRVARCPVFNRAVRFFGSLSGIILIVIPDNTRVNSSIICAKATGKASVRYFGESHLATLKPMYILFFLLHLKPASLLLQLQIL